MFTPKNLHKRAFTLAEVLITLTIIGVIAAITIPTLMQKWSDQADVQRVKQAYSLLSNAFELAIREYGPLNEWDWPEKQNFPTYLSATNSNFIPKKLSPYLKFQKICGSGTGCTPSKSTYDTFKGAKNQWGTGYGAGKAILANGMFVYFGSQYNGLYLDTNGGTASQSNSVIRVDINGAKGPNRYGYDVFFFTISDNRLRGAASGNSSYCDYKGGQTDFSDGRACVHWVLKKGNMDYKYKDVSQDPIWKAYLY